MQATIPALSGFVQRALGRFPPSSSRKYMFIFWDHGKAWAKTRVAGPVLCDWLACACVPVLLALLCACCCADCLLLLCLYLSFLFFFLGSKCK